MADKSFMLEIVSPKRIVFSGPIVSFSAPGVAGGFQVLVNHAPLLAAIGIGELKVRDTEGRTIRYTTGGGFVDVVNNKVTMLAESAEQISEIDAARAEAARDRALNRINERHQSTDIDRARVALARALNRLRAVQTP